MIRITKTVKHLIIINVLFFLAKYAFASSVNLNALLGMHFPLGDVFKPWQVLTSMFMHADERHLLFNMIGLLFFGSAVEQVWGAKKFLFVYFSAGLGAVALHTGVTFLDYQMNLAPILNELNFSGDVLARIGGIDSVTTKDGNFVYSSQVLWSKMQEFLTTSQLETINANRAIEEAVFHFNIFCNRPLIGASGGLMGIMVAFAMLFPEAVLFPIPIKAKFYVPILIALDLFGGFTGASIFGQGNIAHWAHIGGALTAFLMILYWKKNQFNKHRWN